MIAPGHHSSRRIATNAAINASGFLFLSVVLFFTYPHLLAELGDHRMGVFLLLITIIGYFSVFDLGINRAMVRYLAKYDAENDEERLRKTFINGLVLLLLFGLLASSLMFLVAPLIVSSADAGVQKEAVDAIRISSLSMVFLLLNTGFRALLEARQRFITINMITLPASSLNYIVPLLIAYYGGGLRMIAIYLLCGRIAVLALFFLGTGRQRREGIMAGGISMSSLFELIRFGGWLTVTRLLSALFLYFDRFVLGALVSLSAVTYYATPFELTTKLLILAQTFIAVLFPAYTALEHSDPMRYKQLRQASIKIGVTLKACISAGVILLAWPFLSWWISPEFADVSALVLQILALGFFINYAANFPASLLQASGRADVQAWVNLGELPLYLLALFVFVAHWGILGAALAWTLRALADAALLFYFTGRVRPLNDGAETRKLWLLFGMSGALLVIAALLSRFLSGLVTSFLFGLILCLLFISISWLVIFNQSERSYIFSLLLSRGGGGD